ncbi:MAG TPA: alcohol dehydrogenase catalytic domain-containing protein, partial [Candidatus Sulfomarinibacteraceae bacterium]|nr:alcohol dehydrogenase catalytic domain-containing protein [Candidatus Sulfomarinibacteraceae bacterium]
MKAVLTDGHGGEEVLRVRDCPEPDLTAATVRISVAAAGLNRADLLQRRGLYPPPPGAPDALGLECAGTIAEIAPGVAGFAVGDRVMALVAGGGQAESAVVDHGSVMKAPEHLADVEAGGFPEVYLTAFLNLFLLGGLEPDGTALVH